MVKIDIYSGFLGAGKTTLIKKLLADGYNGQKCVLIENEFGDINIDSGFLADTGVEITEMSAGCICCTLVGDFEKALKQVIADFAPERIIIEPSGVGKLSDVAKAVEGVEDAVISSMVAVVDARKCEMYSENFGEFYSNQIEYAGVLVLSHTDGIDEDLLKESLGIIRGINNETAIITTPWDRLTGKQIMNEFKPGKGFEHPDDCTCGCHDHDHEHHHHDHDHEHEHEHEHHHDHEHDHDHEHCHHDHDHDHEHCHHDHDHDHHDHHHADEVFASVGIETIHKFDEAELTAILDEFNGNANILRSKGMVEAKDGSWLFFDYVPGKIDIREGTVQTVGKAVVIGTDINEEELKEKFSAC